ncbi:MAG TPA: hypothetical protein VGK96_20605 [Candidatus Sulfotelmatobacter sp.]
MPLIPPQVLNCCFYLYKTKGDARSGRPFGGTGFLLAVPSQVDERVFHTFGVTNWHVAVRDGCSVIRVNKVGGGVDILDRDPSEWIFRSKWHDLAIIGMPDTDEAMTAIHRQMLLSREETAALEIWSGADVFMVGRFVDHDGRSTNHPSVRFGHISVMPVSGITQPTGATLESYVLDVHSRTGYSGSPTFVYRTLGEDLRRSMMVTGPGTVFVKLLGVHWGQFPEKWKLTATGKVKPSSQPRRFIGEAEIEGLSGMTCAVPSWALLELLDDDPKAKAFLAAKEETLHARLGRDGQHPMGE